MANAVKRWNGSSWVTILDEALYAPVANGNPTGALIMYAASAAPTGYLLCDGSAVSRTTFSALFAVIGTTYGVGDGSTTFNVPDLRGRAPIGVGTGTGLTARTLAGTLGEETHLLTGAESGVPVHNHTQNAHTHTQDAHQHTANTGTNAGYVEGGGGFTFDVGGANVTTGGGGYGIQSKTALATATNQSTTATNIATTAANASSAHNNMQPSIVVNFIIKT